MVDMPQNQTKLEPICLYPVKWFQLLLFNTNNSQILNCSIWPIDGILTGSKTLGQSGPESNEGVFNITQTPRLEPLHHIA